MARAPHRPGGAPLRWSFLDIVAAAAGFGVLAGLAEVLVHLVRRQSGRTLFMAPEHVWQVPLADGLVFLVFGLLYALVALLIPRLRAPRSILGVFGFLAALAVLLLFERIHVAVEVLLALALGVALARALVPRAERLRRLLRLGAPAALLLLGLTGLSVHGLRTIRERRSLASLPATVAPRPNILLLVLDTVRAWNLGLYGYGRATTPGLREWAARGVVFERTLAPAPWTTLSHAVMFTGRHPTELSVTWDRPLDRTFPTLAETLAAAGYATGGFVANYTQAGRPTGLARGFAHYADYPLEVIAILRRIGLFRRLAGVDRVAELVGRRRMIEGRGGADINAEFLQWAGETGGRPWFAFLNYYEAHGPYLPPAPFDTLYFRRPAPVAERYWDLLVRAYGQPPVPVEDLAISLDAYDGGITYLDRQVDALLKSLEQRGQLANTIVVVTSDHGELFGEHGVISHGNNLYLQVLHVPLLLLAPGRAPAGLRVGSMAALRDLPATLLEMAQVPNPGLPGHSLARAWSAGGGQLAADTVLATVDYNRLLPRWPPAPVLKGSMRSVVLDSLQYILNGDGTEELYHLGRDSWEIRNLVSLSDYRSDLDRHRGALRALPPGKGFGPVP
jgi:arylsulfatase A-like enzyme